MSLSKIEFVFLIFRNARAGSSSGFSKYLPDITSGFDIFCLLANAVCIITGWLIIGSFSGDACHFIISPVPEFTDKGRLIWTSDMHGTGDAHLSGASDRFFLAVFQGWRMPCLSTYHSFILSILPSWIHDLCSVHLVHLSQFHSLYDLHELFLNIMII